MRGLLSTLGLVVIAISLSGCRGQTTTVQNPFLAPDRVPPPPTRTMMPGTALPHYSGNPVPNTPVIGQPPAGTIPGATTQPTFTPAPNGVVPPGGWNNGAQPMPGGSASRSFAPGNVQQASASVPITGPSAVQIQPDQQSLRFNTVQPPPYNTPSPGQALPPDPSILPTPQQGAPPLGAQQASYQSTPVQFAQQAVPIENPREVRIRPVPSSAGGPHTADGFRPQGSSQVRKPTLIDRFTPRQREIDGAAGDRFGYDPQYQWVRGQLEANPATGRWTLRYSAAPGSSDMFGGNLTIANPQVLGNLQPGDFVQLRGRVDQSGGGGLPAYNVSVVQRQRI